MEPFLKTAAVIAISIAVAVLWFPAMPQKRGWLVDYLKGGSHDHG